MSKQLVQLYFRNLDITARYCFSTALWPCSIAAIKRFSALSLSCLGLFGGHGEQGAMKTGEIAEAIAQQAVFSQSRVVKVAGFAILVEG